jgi:phosphoenolpyruvate-protein phosphotransferase (PTS system enzyme I)
MIRGIGCSDGIAIGQAALKVEAEVKVVLRQVEDPSLEIERFNNSVEKCRHELERKYNKSTNLLSEEDSSVYKAHLGILTDSILAGEVRKQIQEKRVNAEYVLDEVKKKYARIFDKMQDDFLKRKSESIKNVTEMMIKELKGVEMTSSIHVEDKAIIFAKDLTSSDMMHLDRVKISGIVTEMGGKTSYGAILADQYDVPAVVGAKRIMEHIKEGDLVIVDGTKGEIHINPDLDTLEFYSTKIEKISKLEQIYLEYANKSTVSKDGHRFEIVASISQESEIAEAYRLGAEGIGLLRTDALFFAKDKAPTEDEQFEIYKEAILKSKEKCMTIRSFDCSSGKDIGYIYYQEERNHLMGYRSTRIVLTERELLKDQFRAILRASQFGQVKIAVPFITNIEEWLDVKLIFEDAKMGIDAEGFKTNEVLLGMMIEVPAVAMMASVFAREADFIILGMNKLMQFMLSVDKRNEQISELYDEFHPGVIRLVRDVIAQVHKEGTWIGIVGDITGNEYLAPIFTAMGIDQLSMPATLIAKLRWVVNNTDKSLWEKELDIIVEMSSGKDIKNYLEKRYLEAFIWNL